MNKSYLKISFVSVLLFCAGCTRPPIYSTEYNLDFEYAKNDSVPTQWIFRNSSATGYVLSLDKQVKQHGEASLRARWQEGPTMTVWGGFQNILPGELVAGKELEISGWVKTKDSVNVCAGYGIFPYNPEKYDPDLFGRIDTVGGVRGMSEWTRHTVRQTIDKDVPYVLIAGFVTGKGYCVVRQYRTQNRRRKIRRQSNSGSENGIIRQGEKRAAPIRLSAADLRTGRRGTRRTSTFSDNWSENAGRSGSERIRTERAKCSK